MSASSPSPAGNLSIELWPIERPIPYARNARVCPESAIAKVASSLKEFGFRQAIVVDSEGVIVAGHTRLLAAQRLGLKTVPVHVATDLSPTQIRAYRIADNRTNEETSWDEALLPLEIADLTALDYDIDVLGFDQDELTKLLFEPTPGRTDPDEVPEPPEEPLTKEGDLWHLGEHLLLCGDATDPDQVHRLMGEQRAGLMTCDPPYLVSYRGGVHPATDANGGKRGKNPDKSWDDYTDHDTAVDFYSNFLRTALDQALTADVAVYQCFAILRSEVIWQSWRKIGLLPHQVLIWLKSRSVLTHSHYMWNFEPLMYGWPEGHQPKSKPPADAKAVWEISSKIEDKAGAVHPTMKPVELFRRPIDYHTKVGELIYEPFSGSGTALIAAEMTGRTCYALEISPAFCDVVVKRWENFTDRKAVRDDALD